MTRPPSAPKNDRALRFYKDVLGLDRLHYGIWNPGDPLDIDHLKAAQKRYEDYLIEHIPADAKSVLDVGCGSGALCQELLARGFAAEGLSPDVNQKAHFEATLKAPFHFTRFEDFAPPKRFDAVIMSESCQYIPLDRLFPVARQALAPGGALILCDYFVKDGASGIMAKSGHPYPAFLKAVEASGFNIVARRDITRETAVTLDLAKLWANQILLGADILTEKARSRYRRTTGFLFWLFRKKIANFRAQEDLLDSEAFVQNKVYEFFLMRQEASPGL